MHMVCVQNLSHVDAKIVSVVEDLKCMWLSTLTNIVITMGITVLSALLLKVHWDSKHEHLTSF